MPSGAPSAGNVRFGAGNLYFAPIGTADVTDVTAVIPATWVHVGFTPEGSEFSYEVSTEPVFMAESFDPITTRTVSRAGSLSFTMAESTARNLVAAFNAADTNAVFVTGGTAPNRTIRINPPTPGQEKRRMIVWESEDKRERWLFRQCFQTGSVTRANRKGAEAQMIPVTFAIEAPSGGLQPFDILQHESLIGGLTIT